MKRWHVLAMIVLVTIPVLLLVLRTDDAAPPSRAVPPGISVAEQAARREAAQRLAQLPRPKPHARVGQFSPDAIQAAEEAFRGMASVRGLVIQEQERRNLAQQVLASPEGPALMRAILLEPAFARTAFGDYQAEARFYAIAVLKEAARQGDVELVAETTAGLVAQLSGVSGELDRGRSEDLMGMAAIVGETVGSGGLKDVSAPMLARLGCTPELAKSVRVLCLRGLFQGVWAADGIEEAQAMVDRLRTM